MTRLSYGVLRPDREWINLREIVGRALKQMARPLGLLKVEVQIAKEVPILHVDPILIEQALVNILDNAAKYSPAGGRVEIRAGLEAGRVKVTMSDEGPGIPPEARDTVFDVFYRVRAGDKQPAGTGLGLSICHGLIEAHGGRIEALPGPGARGTTIAFWLPVDPLPAIERYEREPKGGGPRDEHGRDRPYPGDRRRAADPQIPAHQPQRVRLRGGRGGAR